MKTFLKVGGMPGCGKDTISLYVKHKFAFIPIMTSDLIKLAGLDDYIKQGKLAPDEDVTKLVETFIRQHIQANRFLGNGTIRNPNQARMIPDMLFRLGFTNFVTIHLVCDKDVAIHRMKRRALEQTGRLDNDPQVWEKRFSYCKDQDLINNILSEYGPVIEIDANPHIEDVAESVGKKLVQYIDVDNLHEEHPEHGVIPRAPHQIC
jgi:adenylate kinase